MLGSIPVTRRSSVGDRTFIVAAASVWNKLPQDIRSSTLLPVFRRRLKTHLQHAPTQVEQHGCSTATQHLQ